MALKNKLEEDLREALKGKEMGRISTIRFLLAQVKNKEIEKKGREGISELTDTEVMEVLQRELKKRREAIELFLKGGREDLASKERSEIMEIQKYLPPPLGEREIDAVLTAVISDGAKDFNSVMREAMKALKGKVDGKLVGELIKKKLPS